MISGNIKSVFYKAHLQNFLKSALVHSFFVQLHMIVLPPNLYQIYLPPKKRMHLLQMLLFIFRRFLNSSLNLFLHYDDCPINPCLMKYIYIVKCFSTNIPIGGEKICVSDHVVTAEVTATVVDMAVAVLLY